MSDLHRSVINARLAKLHQLETTAPFSEEDEEGEVDSLGPLPDQATKGFSEKTAGQRVARRRKAPNLEYAPISADGYFQQAVEVSVPDSHLIVRVYYTPSANSASDGTVMVCHHGAGYSGLSFACFAKEAFSGSNGECGILAFDARRHGKTRAIDGASDEDLSIKVLSSDLLNLLHTLFPDPLQSPVFLLVGHSMGGSVAVDACPHIQGNGYRVAGVAVLDVVEGFSLEALPHMHKLLNTRPDGFDSIEEAVEYHIVTNSIRNPVSARISVPPLFVPGNDSTLSPQFIWRTPLKTTAPYWEDWFIGLSKKFLATRAARLLVLAGTERLDKELMIGQMQGKFQLIVVPDTGHMIHEDNPGRLAEILVDFWRRNERIQKGFKKVGEK